MDVVCSRCQTEYEFDDALISPEGTSVRCTSCGFQFRIVPEAAAPALSGWTIVRQRDGSKESYKTLGALQRAIAQGEVLSSDHISHGGDPPRPIAEIVELNPLFLAQRESRLHSPPEGAPRPSGDASGSPGVTSPFASQSQGGTGTLIGLPAAPTPVRELANSDIDDRTQWESGLGELSDADDRQAFAGQTVAGGDSEEEEMAPLSVPPTRPWQSRAFDNVVVPSSPLPSGPPPGDAPLSPELSESLRPQDHVSEQVLSALSQHPSSPYANSAASDAPLSPRHSLKDELGLSSPPAPSPPAEAPAAPRPEESYSSSSPIEQPRPAVVPSQDHSPALPAQVQAPAERVSARRKDAMVPEAPAPELSPEQPSAAPRAVSPSEPDSGERMSPPGFGRTTSPSEPEITPQMTPTPLGMSAYQRVDVDRSTSLPGVPMRKNASSRSLVLLLVIGVIVFLGLTVGQKWIRPMIEAAQEEGAVSDDATEATESNVKDLSQKLRALEVDAFIQLVKTLKQGSTEPPPLSSNITARAAQLSGELRRASASEQVRALALTGKLAEARQLLQDSTELSQKPALGALVDLADRSALPSFPSLARRVKDERAGEGSDHLMRSVYVFALFHAGQENLAAAELDKLPHGKKSERAPAYEALRELVATGTLEPTPAVEPDAPAVAGKDADEAAVEASPKLSQPEEREVESPKELEVREPKTEPKAEPEAEEPPAPKTTAKEREAKSIVARADELWGHGDHAGAVALYTQVVALVGTKHFLGRRASSRIALSRKEAQ